MRQPGPGGRNCNRENATREPQKKQSREHEAFDCTTAAGLRDALARTHLETLDNMAEDALRIVGERVVEYASTCSVATLFETSRELRGHTNA